MFNHIGEVHAFFFWKKITISNTVEKSISKSCLLFGKPIGRYTN